MELKKSQFYYELPKELIAQTPLSDRSSSRLLLVDKKSGETRHESFKNIANYLRSGDCLVLNDTKVIPARLMGRRADTGGAVETLLLERRSGNIWECLVRPGRKCRAGQRLSYGDGSLEGVVLDTLDDGNRLIEFFYDGIWEELLDRLGEMPLPPYITEKLKDRDRYQTVYARYEGSAAAPTAGLHFTPKILEGIEKKGVRTAYVTLHVGLGTFRPVKEEIITNHRMHSESYEIGSAAAQAVNETKKSGGRIICVGTTSCRTIESASNDDGTVKEGRARTDIFIYPGYKFKVTDGLITNFHLPESTLIMLVAALAGRENVLSAYNEAVREKYRFFSFGDASFFADFE